VPRKVIFRIGSFLARGDATVCFRCWEDGKPYDDVKRQALDKWYEARRTRPNPYEGRAESEDARAMREHAERESLQELEDILRKEETDYWANDRR
jgi:hypothetical protein